VSRLVALVLALGLAAAGCTSGGGSAAAECERIPGVRAGLCLTAPDARTAAPSGEGPVLGDEGATTSLGERAGQPVVVNFWGSWCGPCRAEQPELNEVADRFEGEVTFLGVNVNDPSANALAYVREFEPPYPSIHDPAGTYAASFEGVGPNTMPSTILVDAEGRVAARLFGATTATELTVLTSRLLEEG
jgi:thiol-disulfide isomerase/thioredoxin